MYSFLEELELGLGLGLELRTRTRTRTVLMLILGGIDMDSDREAAPIWSGAFSQMRYIETHAAQEKVNG